MVSGCADLQSLLELLARQALASVSVKTVEEIEQSHVLLSHILHKNNERVVVDGVFLLVSNIALAQNLPIKQSIKQSIGHSAYH